MRLALFIFFGLISIPMLLFLNWMIWSLTYRLWADMFRSLRNQKKIN